LRQRTLLAFATRDETYSSARVRADDEGSAIRGASVEGATLVLQLHRGVHWGTFGSTTLYVVADDQRGGVRLRIDLPEAPGPVALVDIATETSTALGWISGPRRDREIRLPRALFRDAPSIFAKLERWHAGFFDEAGWSRIPLPHVPRRSHHGVLACPVLQKVGMTRHTTGRPLVLVAEDDARMRDLIVASFQADGYDVTAAGDLDRLGESVGVDTGPDGVAVIVTDNRMPGCSGLELLAALRAAHWRTPVILITAFGSEATHRSAAALGATAVLDKPFPLEQLRDVVRTAIRPC
jgi:CheY-like chemotaxis protein